MLSHLSEQCILLFVSWFVYRHCYWSILSSNLHFGLQPAPNDAVRSKAAAVMRRIGTGLLKQTKGDKSQDRKNVLSVLIRANTMEEKAHQMKDEDVLSRAYKFILD